ncbi:hypothetical protein M23134_02705 [Microscilla marina ATCC 23134]|uniref:Uncharacterized protein n=1 Tax=Microscilla marina ATCC 23134 TaxID=313606 RepID=A1ZZW9_MICM2|nr:hypothetical protein M23134_02705 [Microscilla marina ATCC 23134]
MASITPWFYQKKQVSHRTIKLYWLVLQWHKHNFKHKPPNTYGI